MFTSVCALSREWYGNGVNGLLFFDTVIFPKIPSHVKLSCPPLLCKNFLEFIIEILTFVSSYLVPF